MVTQSRSPVEILRAAKAKIDTPEKWNQGCGARDALGRQVPSYSKNAVRFCAYCAIDPELSAKSGSDTERAVILLRKVIGTDIITWNEAKGRMYADIMDGFDRAISLAEQSPQDTVE